MLVRVPLLLTPAHLICNGRSQRGKGVGNSLYIFMTYCIWKAPFLLDTQLDRAAYIPASRHSNQALSLFLILAISLFLTFYCCPIFSLSLSSLHFALQINAYHFAALLPVLYVERMCSQHSWGDGAFWLMVSRVFLGCCMGMLELARTEIISQWCLYI